MRVFWFALLLAIVAARVEGQTTPAPQEDESRGWWLYGQCSAAARMFAASGDIPIQDVVKGEHCTGYINGSIDTLSFTHPGLLCTAGARYATLVRVYIAYMDAHPKELDEHRALGVEEAILGSYRCEAKAQQTPQKH